MGGKILLEYNSLPAVAPSFVRAAATFSGGLAEGETIPDIQARVSGISGREGRLDDYRKVCGFEQGSDLPLTFPHIQAFPVHLAVLTHADFPLKLLGLVHVRNSITRNASMPLDARYDLEVSVGGHRQANKGIEFDMHTQYFNAAGDCVWTSSSTMLSRTGGQAQRSGGRREKPVDDTGHLEAAGEWRAPADIGRQYAKAAGDYNPIHLSAISAKLFGFPRAIAHGMWLKARCAADLEAAVGGRPCTMEVAFKKPVFLPGKVVFEMAEQGDGIDFALSKPDDDVKHMQGRVSFQAPA